MPCDIVVAASGGVDPAYDHEVLLVRLERAKPVAGGEARFADFREADDKLSLPVSRAKAGGGWPITGNGVEQSAPDRQALLVRLERTVAITGSEAPVADLEELLAEVCLGP